MMFSTKGIDTSKDNPQLEEFRFITSENYDAFSDYLVRAEKIIEKIYKDHHENKNVELGGVNDEYDYQEVYFRIQEEYQFSFSNFKNITYRSLWIAVFSFLEESLIHACLIGQELKKIEKGIDDIRAKSHFKKLLKYITEVLGIKFNKEMEVKCKNFILYNSIRDGISHSSFISLNVLRKKGKFKEMKNKIKNKPDLNFNSSDGIIKIKSIATLKEFLKSTDEFLKFIYEELYKFVPVAK